MGSILMSSLMCKIPYLCVLGEKGEGKGWKERLGKIIQFFDLCQKYN